MTLLEVLYAIGALVTAVGGVILIIRELQRRERRAADEQINALDRQLAECRDEALGYHSWAYEVARLAVDAGLVIPPPPPLPLALGEKGET